MTRLEAHCIEISSLAVQYRSNITVISPLSICLSPARADFDQVALRPRHSPYPMLPVDRATAITLEHAAALGVTEVDNLQRKSESQLRPKKSPGWPTAAFHRAASL